MDNEFVPNEISIKDEFRMTCVYCQGPQWPVSANYPFDELLHPVWHWGTTVNSNALALAYLSYNHHARHVRFSVVFISSHGES